MKIEVVDQPALLGPAIWVSNQSYGMLIQDEELSNPENPSEKYLDAGANMNEEIFNQILSTFKFLDQGSYVCPSSGYVDCMPILDETKRKACSPEAMTWYEANCPNFKGAAY